MNKILILGGTGLLGAPVARRLQADGFEVRLLARDREKARAMFDESFEIVAGDLFEAHSAGPEPKGINPYTVRFMEEIGLHLDGHRSQPLTEYMSKVRSGYMITVCGDADEKCPSTFAGMGQGVRGSGRLCRLGRRYSEQVSGSSGPDRRTHQRVAGGAGCRRIADCESRSPCAQRF